MYRPTSRQKRLAVFSGLVAAALLLSAISPVFALSIAPLLILVAALVLGAFPGEELIDRLRERQSLRVASPRASVALLIRRVVFVRPTGRALAFALAMRPPPVFAARA